MAKWKELEHKQIVTAGQAFAGQLKRIRTRHEWTQRQLADRLAELGYPIDRPTLSKLERGGERARNVKLEEVLAIAYALDVSPYHLIAPYSMESRLEVVPKERPFVPGVVRRWLAADDELPGQDLPGQDPRFFFTELPPEYIDEVRAQARELKLGGRTTAQAVAMRQEMIEKGEAPPIIPNEQEEETDG
jgi:transcriptional regulator with XRE-family HTH domain